MDISWYFLIGIYALGFVGLFAHTYTIMPDYGYSRVREVISNILASALLALIWPFFASWWLFKMLDPRG